MHRYIFLKFLFREPYKNALLALLILVATFTTTLRSLEFFILDRHIHTIGQSYKSLLTLHPSDTFGDVSYAAALLEDHPQVRFTDTRSVYQGFLTQNDSNTDRVVVQGITAFDLLPITQGNRPLLRLTQGRAIDRSDYLAQSPVVMVTWQFARLHNLELGDELQVRVPREQTYTDIVGAHLYHSPDEYLGFFSWLVPEGNLDRGYTYLNLEVVGFYAFTMMGMDGQEPLDLFVPSSVLTDIQISPDPAHIHWEKGHLPANLFSFVLTDARHEQYFFLSYEPIFEEMGLGLSLRSANSHYFWAVATPLLTTLGFNVGLFGVLFVLVALLVVFLYLRKHLKNMAIMCSLGVSGSRVLGDVLTGIASLTFLPVVVGISVAQLMTQAMINDILVPLSEFGTEPYEVISFYPMLLIYLGVGTYLLMLVFTGLGSWLILTRPTLELLQAQVSVKRKKAPPVLSQVRRVQTGHTHLNWIVNINIRQPIRALLVIGITGLFVGTLGFIQGAIIHTQKSIDQIYNKTLVFGAFEASPPVSGFAPAAFHFAAGGAYIQGSIRGHMWSQIQQLGLTTDLYAEAGNIRGFVIALGVDSLIPDDWYVQIGYDPSLATTHADNLLALDFLYGFSNFERFIYEHSPDMEGVLENIAITFAPGFDPAIFDTMISVDVSREENALVPVIVPYRLLEARGHYLGQTVTLVYARVSLLTKRSRLGIIVGYHNGMIHATNVSGAVLVPLHHLQDMFTPAALSYTTLNFYIDPLHNRHLETIREELGGLVLMGGHVPIQLRFEDEAIRNHLLMVSQTLLLLELLYPVALGFGMVILCTLSVLLMLQSFKTVALLRALGKTEYQTLMVWLGEYALLFGIGTGLGALGLSTVGWSVAWPLLMIHMGVLVSVVLICILITGWIVMLQPPLSLLQVRE